MTMKQVTRRDFLKGAAGAAVAGAAAGRALALQDEKKTGSKSKEDPPRKAKSRVVLVRDEKVIDENRKVDAAVLEKMLDRGTAKLLDEPDVKKAWSRLIRPDDVVGIKSNVWRFLPTPGELEQALKKRVMDTGVPEDKISIDDRGVLRDPVFQKATALINARPMRSHHWAGVGSLIKNYVMFTPRPYDWHDDACANLAGLWDLPEVKGKTRLNILVMLTPQFYGKGPHNYNAKYTWAYKGLILSLDPVAADATGVRILKAQREKYFGEDRPFEVPVKHIEVAEKKYKLGIADPERIDLIKMGWEKDILI
jgi:hypothetical protein